jgi:hypothetical protein
LDLSLFSYVRADKDRLGTSSPDETTSFVTFVFPHVDYGHLGSLSPEAESYGAANPARRTCNDGNLVI